MTKRQRIEAALSGGIYLPVEVYELIDRPTAVKAIVLIFNVGIVGYLFSVRWHRSP